MEELTLDETARPQVQIDKKEKKEGLFGKAWNKKKLDKPNNVAYVYLRENGQADFGEVESKHGFFFLNGKTYHERKDCIWTAGKDRVPLAIIPEWNVTPLGTKEWDERSLQNKCAILQDHVMKGIRYAERVRMGEKDGAKINMKNLIVIGIIVIVGIAILVGYT